MSKHCYEFQVIAQFYAVNCALLTLLLTYSDSVKMLRIHLLFPECACIPLFLVGYDNLIVAQRLKFSFSTMTVLKLLIAGCVS